MYALRNQIIREVRWLFQKMDFYNHEGDTKLGRTDSPCASLGKYGTEKYTTVLKLNQRVVSEYSFFAQITYG